MLNVKLEFIVGRAGSRATFLDHLLKRGRGRGLDGIEKYERQRPNHESSSETEFIGV